MRSLAFAPYATETVAARLLDGAVPMGARFDLLDNADGLVGALPTVDASTGILGPGAVFAASVSMDVDRAIKGSLSLSMLPDPRLVGQLFRRRIRPWIRFGMPAGDLVEFPMGVFVWNVPARDLVAPGVEEWNVVLGDKGHVLDAGGPGVTGFSAVSGEYVTDVMKRALAAVGLTNYTRISSSTAIVAQDMTWTTVDADGSPATWRTVLQDLAGPANLYSVFFDGAGLPVARAIPDLTKYVEDYTYSTTSASILIGATLDQDLDRIANRVTVVAKAPGGFTGYSVADANTLAPAHPLAQNQIGYYIDAPPIEDPISSTQADLDARARSELLQALSCYQSASLRTLANPAHEAFDVVAFQWTGDSEFSSSARFHERAWSLDLFDFSMTHSLRRLVAV